MFTENNQVRKANNGKPAKRAGNEDSTISGDGQLGMEKMRSEVSNGARRVAVRRKMRNEGSKEARI